MKILTRFTAAWVLVFFSALAYANYDGLKTSPSANSNITANVTASGSEHWQTVTMKLTNTGDKSIDLRDASITFATPTTLNSIYGVQYSAPLSWAPAAFQSSNNLNTVNLNFASDSWVKTMMPVGTSITITFGTSSAIDADAVQKSVNVYTQGVAPVLEGNIAMTAPSKPGSQAAEQANVTVTGPNSYNKTVNLAWNSKLNLTQLAYGDYTIKIHQSGAYPGGADQSVTLSKTNKSKAITLTYGAPVQQAKLDINMPSAPALHAPVQKIMLKNISHTSEPEVINAAWGQHVVKDNLTAGDKYQVWANDFQFNGNLYTPNYTETHAQEFTATKDQTVNVSFAYQAQPIPTVNANVSLSGLPDGHTGHVTFTGVGSSNSYQFDLANGTSAIKLAAGQYNIAAENVTAGGTSFIANVATPQTVSTGSAINISCRSHDLI